jgi:hypothetical protein
MGFIRILFSQALNPTGQTDRDDLDKMTNPMTAAMTITGYLVLELHFVMLCGKQSRIKDSNSFFSS